MNQEAWPLTLYYDGACPLCAREVQLLRRRADPKRLHLVDIADDAFDETATGMGKDALQALLHGRFADGRWVTGLDATLWSWRAAGLSLWAAPLTWRPLRPLLNLAYRLFCHMRPYLSWLPHPDGSARCGDGTCAVEKPPLKSAATAQDQPRPKAHDQ